MNDYERMARIIRYLDGHYREQPSLERLAAAASLSPFHFHRTFTAWTGVTPKDFVQCLTLAHAKSQLRRGSSVLTAALDAGLSGPGRLHDLCVTLEAASPGDIKSGGRGLVIHYGYVPTPFGKCLAARSERGICHLSFLNDDDPRHAERQLAEEWPAARLKRHDRTAEDIVARIFHEQPQLKNQNPLRAWVKASPFQLRVWRALLAIPPGQLVSYGQLAKALDIPQSARAVGTAIAANSLALLIPCHRVIQGTGVTGGYRWGAGRKRALLAWEAVMAGKNTKYQDPTTR